MQRSVSRRFQNAATVGLIASAALVASCGGDPRPGEPLVLIGIEPPSAAAGDTVLLVGSGFRTGPSRDMVAFSALGFSRAEGTRFAVPFAAAADRIAVVVPEGAYTGAVRVESLLPMGGGVFGVGPPRLSSNALDFDCSLRAGGAAKLFYSATAFTMPLALASAEEEYLLILFDSAPPPDENMATDYRIAADAPCALAAIGKPDVHGGAAAAEVSPERPQQKGSLPAAASEASIGPHVVFERRRREEILEALRAGEQSAPVLETRRPALYGPGAAPAAAEFNVFGNLEGSALDPASYQTVNGVLKYEGQRTLLYIDASTHASCITDAEAAALGETFELGIHPTNTAAFGSESDINGDGKVAILLTPVVNRLTPPGGAAQGFVAGFFMPGDLLPRLMPTGTSNGMEIFYSMVPDPGGIYGNVYEKQRALEVIKGVLAHEFLHMIMFNYRILIFGQGYLGTYMAELWVDEGLAHIAENLNGFHDDNIRRARLFLLDPGKTTLIHGGDKLDERGACFLFFRYLGDRFGEDVFRRIVQTKKTGTANIEHVTGLGFKELFADWAATMYFESAGVEPADQRYRYTSIDLAADFEPLRVRTGRLCLGPVTGYVRSMGPEYVRLERPGPATLALDVTCASYGRMNAVLVRVR